SQFFQIVKHFFKKLFCFFEAVCFHAPVRLCSRTFRNLIRKRTTVLVLGGGSLFYHCAFQIASIIFTFFAI
ncbi:MAG: hypothetical protein Q4C60_10820, partial [Eubacteriales bacterium]|nr:hypothetical protein [Eubacteriales bacterium]